MLDDLVVGKLGTISGKLLLGRRQLQLERQLRCLRLHLTNHVVARSSKLGGPLMVDLDLDTNNPGAITGSVSNAAWPTNAYLWADLAEPTPGITNYTSCCH